MNPFRVDSLRISPQLAGERGIAADTGSGELLFSDPVAGQRRLADLVGLRQLPGIITAGPGGQFASVNEAMKAAAGSWDRRSGLPALVAVVPGVVREPLVVPKEAWISLAALGPVVVRVDGPDPAILLQGGNQPTRLELAGLELDCAGAASAIDVRGDVGGAILGMQDCQLRSWGPRTAALHSEGLAQLQLRRSQLYASAGSVALQVSGNAGLDLDSVLLSGGFSASTSGSWFFGNSRVAGPSIGEFTSTDPAVFWNCRLAGEFLLGGVLDIAQCYIESLAVEKGSQVVVRSSQVNKLDPTSEASVDLDSYRGVAEFAGTDVSRVRFPIPRLRSNYHVTLTLLDRPAGDEMPWVSRLDRGGFDVSFLSPQSLLVLWAVSSA